MQFKHLVLLRPSDWLFGAVSGVKRLFRKVSILGWGRRKMVAGLALRKIAEWLECSPRKEELPSSA